MWVVRNVDNELELWKNKPYRTGTVWSSSDGYPLCDLPAGTFPDLTWADEPEEVVMTMRNPLLKMKCSECGREFKYRKGDVREWCDFQPSSGYEYGAEYVNCPHCGGYNELHSW